MKNRITGIKNSDDKEALPPQSINVLALVKNDGERYVFLYDDKSAPEMIKQLMKQSEDPELSLTPYDAAVLSQKVRKLLGQGGEEQKENDEFGEGLEFE